MFAASESLLNLRYYCYLNIQWGYSDIHIYHHCQKHKHLSLTNRLQHLKYIFPFPPSKLSSLDFLFYFENSAPIGLLWVLLPVLVCFSLHFLGLHLFVWLCTSVLFLHVFCLTDCFGLCLNLWTYLDTLNNRPPPFGLFLLVWTALADLGLWPISPSSKSCLYLVVLWNNSNWTLVFCSWVLPLCMLGAGLLHVVDRCDALKLCTAHKELRKSLVFFIVKTDLWEVTFSVGSLLALPSCSPQSSSQVGKKQMWEGLEYEETQTLFSTSVSLLVCLSVYMQDVFNLELWSSVTRTHTCTHTVSV